MSPRERVIVLSHIALSKRTLAAGDDGRWRWKADELKVRVCVCV